MMNEPGRILRFGLVLLASVASVLAEDYAVKMGDEAPPSALAEPIRSVLSAKPIQLMQGDKPALEVWWREAVPLKAKPSSAFSSLDAIGETTLVGAFSVAAMGFRDYKDNEIPKGVYTARFVMQPQNGDHLGTADYNTFLALLSPQVDQALDSFQKYTPMVKASGKLTPSGHPLIISLRPVSSSEGEFPALTEPMPEHKAIRLKVPGKSPEGENAELVFELVYEGHGHIQ